MAGWSSYCLRMSRVQLRFPVCGWALSLFCSAVVTPSHAAELRAGLARIDITPSTPVMLAGYASRKELSQGVHDRLFARAIAFERSPGRLVLVAVENCGFYGGTAEPLREAVLAASGLKPSELFLCATHTHSAPALGLDGQRSHSNNVHYTQALQGRLVEVVRQALQNLSPMEVGAGVGSSPVGVNRREVVADKASGSKVVLGRNPTLMTDREVQVLKLTRPDTQRPAAVLFAYGTHSTALGGRNYLISGDVHGLAAGFVERYYGSGATAVGFAGASGDIDPWYRVLSGFKTNNGWMPEPILLGTLLGEEVVHVSDGTGRALTNTEVRTARKTVYLPAKGQAADSAAGATAPMNVTVARLGDIAFVGWGGEVFNSIGKVVKDRSPFRQTYVLTHCNGAAGYVPTSASYPEGGYEVQSSPFAAGADAVLIQETLDLLTGLKSG